MADCRQFGILAIISVALILLHSSSVTNAAAPAAPAPAAAAAQTEQLDKLSKDLKDSLFKLTGAIRIGNPCSVPNDRNRTELYTSILNYINTTKGQDGKATELAPLKLAVDTFVSAVNAVNGSFCNLSEMLRCGGNGTCVCASSGDHLGIKNVKINRVGETCKIAKTTVCGPKIGGTMPKQEFSLLPPNCEAGSTCLVAGSKNTCSEKQLETDIMKPPKGTPTTTAKPVPGHEGHPHGSENATHGTVSFNQIIKKIRAGACVCSGTEKSSAWNGFQPVVLTFAVMFRFM